MRCYHWYWTAQLCRTTDSLIPTHTTQALTPASPRRSLWHTGTWFRTVPLNEILQGHSVRNCNTHMYKYFTYNTIHTVCACLYLEGCSSGYADILQWPCWDSDWNPVALFEHYGILLTTRYPNSVLDNWFVFKYSVFLQTSLTLECSIFKLIQTKERVKLSLLSVL